MTELPLFPLQWVAFPGEEVNLHIFEPRYKKLIRECEERDLTFGLPPFVGGKLSRMGTELQLQAVTNRKADGSCDVQLLGKRVFRIIEFLQPLSMADYLRGKVAFQPEVFDAEINLQVQLRDKLQDLFNLMLVDRQIPPNPSAIQTFQFAHYVGLSQSRELELIEIPSEIERCIFLLNHLNTFIPQVQEMETLRKRARLNGHIKRFDPLDF